MFPDMTRPRTYSYIDPGQREPILVVDHTQHELTGFGIAVTAFAVTLNGWLAVVLLGLMRKDNRDE